MAAPTSSASPFNKSLANREPSTHGYEQPSGWLLIYGCFGVENGRKPRHQFTAAYDPTRTLRIQIANRHKS
jgi:hypothetical protein